MHETNPVRGEPDCINDFAGLSSPSTDRESHLSRVDDAHLIRAAQQGNTAAFGQLVQRYDRAILRLTVHLSRSHEDGQDIYQEAFLRAYKHLPQFRFECSFYTWIYRIATNLCLDHLRRKRSRNGNVTTTNGPNGEKREALDLIPDHSAAASPERTLAAHILREHIIRALSHLSPRERMVFELKHYHGLQMRTVARILQTTEGTVRNTLFRATHKLRSQLSEVR